MLGTEYDRIRVAQKKVVVAGAGSPPRTVPPRRCPAITTVTRSGFVVLTTSASAPDACREVPSAKCSAKKAKDGLDPSTGTVNTRAVIN
jgi:hypothetical protein